MFRRAQVSFCPLKTQPHDSMYYSYDAHAFAPRPTRTRSQVAAGARVGLQHNVVTPMNGTPLLVA